MVILSRKAQVSKLTKIRYSTFTEKASPNFIYIGITCGHFCVINSDKLLFHETYSIKDVSQEFSAQS